MSDLSRRRFLKIAGAAGVAGAAACSTEQLGLKALEEIASDLENPLATYPDRGWESTYLDQYNYDSSFTWVCSPNCTHECRLRGFVRNGIFLRSEQNYDNDRISGLDGKKASASWNPRGCLNGFTFQRRVYGPYRLRHPVIRKGWKEWADAGYPDLDDENRTKFKFDSRGTDEFLKIGWDEVLTYAANGFIAIAKRYSGDEGKKRLLDQGYQPEMLEHWDGAGTRTIKCRGGMGLLGVMGKYGMYRFANSLAYLDQHVRGVDEDESKGARAWSNYTWHGDQAPGHPFVHGVQASDCDLNDLRSTKLQVLIGKNLIENKRADNHYFSEGMERGAKIYVVTPEYSPSGTKADVWIPIRPNSDTAFLLGVTRLMIDKGWYDKDFVQKFTDFPLLVRSDTLERMQAKDLFEGYTNQDLSEGPSYKIQGLTDEQREIIGDFVVYNEATSDFAAVTREDIGDTLAQKGITPAIDGRWDVTLVSGETVEVFTLFAGYKVHLEDYDLDSVVEITESPRELIEQLAYDFYTIKPAAIHEGEGINHWFHATEVNRATYLPLILTGNIGQRGAGSHTWAGNYKAGLFQASPRTGPGFKGWVGEDPFDMNLDPEADGKDIKAHGHTMGEEPAFWNYSERALVVDTPDAGRKAFTGHTHMPSPTKAMWFCNVNIINNAKWAYEMVKNVDPHVEMIMGTDIEFNGTIEFSDIGLPATSWAETEQPEITAACSNPFLQIWKGGIKPVYDSRDDVVILAQMAAKIGELTGDDRYAKYWKFALEGRTDVYIQRLLDASTTTRGYEYDDVMAGKYGEPGAALMMFRTYPRVPFYEQIHDSEPFHTRTGRLQAYNDEPECIEYGENFIVHREGPEATPYLPNVIISSNPNVRPESYGIPLDHMGADERQVRNVKMPWREVKRTENPLWKAGYQFYCLTPKTRHATHSSWQVVDWHLIWNNQFGDPYRVDKRSPGVGEHTLHVNPQAGKDQGINDGDYVYVDANPADRPYAGWKPNDPFYKVARLMLRVKYNPAYPYNIIMMKHGPWMATDRTVKAHETRKDGRAVAEGTGYQSSFRYGSQQSITRGWLMPMHTTDTLFHKAKAKMGFIFGGEADNHAINTVPKETLVRMTKAEDGGLGGRGVWQPATKGMSPDAENELMQAYMRGEFIEEG